MTVPQPISREEFNQQVRDCLAHLYDFAFLQNHPLVHLLLPDLSGAHRVQMFRERMTAAIDNLRPPNDIDFYDKHARFYNILVLRYVERQQTQEVIHRLALSDRQFYREHPRALEALSGILWEQLTGTPVAEAPSAAPVQVSVESEVRRLHIPHEQNHIMLETMLAGAIDAVHELAAAHNISISLSISGEQVLFSANRTVLRQVVLLLLTQLILRLQGMAELAVRGELNEDDYLIQIAAPPLEQSEQLQANLEQHDALQTLVGTLGGTLTFAHAPQFAISLRVPLKRQVILLLNLCQSIT